MQHQHSVKHMLLHQMIFKHSAVDKISANIGRSNITKHFRPHASEERLRGEQACLDTWRASELRKLIKAILLHIASSSRWAGAECSRDRGGASLEPSLDDVSSTDGKYGSWREAATMVRLSNLEEVLQLPHAAQQLVLQSARRRCDAAPRWAPASRLSRLRGAAQSVRAKLRFHGGLSNSMSNYFNKISIIFLILHGPFSFICFAIYILTWDMGISVLTSRCWKQCECFGSQISITTLDLWWQLS